MGQAYDSYKNLPRVGIADAWERGLRDQFDEVQRIGNEKIWFRLKDHAWYSVDIRDEAPYTGKSATAYFNWGSLEEERVKRVARYVKSKDEGLLLRK